MGARGCLGLGQQPELEHLPWSGQIPATILCCRRGSVRPGRNPRGHRTAPAPWHLAFQAPSSGSGVGSVLARRGHWAELPTDTQQWRTWLATVTSAPQHVALGASSPHGDGTLRGITTPRRIVTQETSSLYGAVSPCGALPPQRASLL